MLADIDFHRHFSVILLPQFSSFANKGRFTIATINVNGEYIMCLYELKFV